MTKDLISTIIKGKKITGDDIGRLLLADMAEEYKEYFTTGKVKSIISQDEFNRMLNTLPNNAQIERYNRYVCIHNTIKTYLAIMSGVASEVECRLELCKRILGNIKLSLQSESIRNSMPLILTEFEYTTLMNEYEDFVKTGEFSYLDILTHLLSIQIEIYAGAIKDNPEETKPDAEVDAILEKYKKETVKNPDLRRVYMSMYETSEDGYFKFSNFMTPLGDNRKEFLYNCSLQNIKVIDENVSKYTKKDLQKPVDEVFLKDVLTPEVMAKNIEYKLYDTPPNNVYKYDIISLISDAYNIDTEDKEEQKEILNTFNLMCKEIPEAIELIRGRMNKYKCLKLYKDLPIKDMLKTKIAGKDLLRDDVPDYKSWGMFNLREDNPRAYNGIAVIKEECLSRYDKEYVIDENGCYKKQNEDLAFNNMVEDSFLDTIDDIGQQGKSFIPAVYDRLKQVNAFNEFIKIIADVTDLPVVKEAFSCDTSKLEDSIKEYNGILKLLLLITIPYYGRNNGKYEEAIKTRDNIFKALPYIDKTLAEITPEDREKGAEFISDINNFKGVSPIGKWLYILTGCGD